MALSSELEKKLIELGLDPNYVEKVASSTIAEDLAGGEDVTSVATIPAEQRSIAEYRNRRAGVVAGLYVAAAVLEVGGITSYEILVDEGTYVQEGRTLIRATSSTRKLLLTERTALNFLGRLSGIATLTRRWVDEVSEFGVSIRDTRKTTPGLRELEKFAVRIGGGVNHRMSLSDAALIKDNHVVAAGGVKQAFSAVRQKYPNLPLEVEVDSLEQLKEVVESGAELVSLDNMSLEQCRAAVTIAAGRTKLEASGNLTLENAKAYAKTGVDFLAVGALTHSAPVFDIGLDLRME
jgi:nicotinate-nucleotide pyrophosphorylase (carboxylating)